MVKVLGVPGQPAAEGVTVIVAITAVLPVLMAAKAGIFPEPLAANPIVVLLFVQLKVVLFTDPENVIAFAVAALHNV